jgi:hypothetical protein
MEIHTLLLEKNSHSFKYKENISFKIKRQDQNKTKPKKKKTLNPKILWKIKYASIS